MKQIILVSVFVLCFCVAGFAQTEEEERPCPEIQVQGPEEALQAGDTMTFRAIVDGESQKHAYEWTVSAGKIISGTDDVEIQVATTPDLMGTNITATVKIKDLPENCSNEASAVGLLEQIQVVPLMKIDEYGKLLLKDEYPRFKNLFVQHLQEPGTKGYILFEIGHNEEISDVKKRLTSIFNFLDENKFDRNLLIFDICRGERNRTVFQAIPNGADYPSNEDCQKIYIDFNEQ